jgi:hypothetical protein
MIGTHRTYVNRLCKDGKLETSGYQVNIDTPFAQDLLQQGKRKKSRKASGDTDKRSERKAELELRKIEQQGLNLDIKNRQLRGKLRDSRMQDEAFISLLQAAFDRIRGITSTLEPIINAAIAEGFDSRPESEALMLKYLHDSEEDIRKQWDALVRSWESTAVVMSGADAISDG